MFRSSLFLATLISTNIAFAVDRLNCANIIDVTKAKGQTYMSFMQEGIKPVLDGYATEGYVVADAASIVDALDNVSPKVRNKVLKATGGIEGLQTLAEGLEGKEVTLYTLPGEIAAVGSQFGRDRYNLSTFIGLASCGGAILKFDEDNYAYNIHYGTGDQAKDDRTGRSFGAGADRNADDASDKAYLTDLEKFVTSGEDLSSFYKTLLQALTNTDVSGYSKIASAGQTVLTDFLAVYTAEQDRNLMDGRITLHWDAALLEVTLLSAFHAGQEEITMLYFDPNLQESVLTNEVYNQSPGCEAKFDRKRKASLIDYWQFSSSTDQEHCNRSGINITKKQFRALGLHISNYMRTHHADLVDKVEAHFTGVKTGGNVFEELSQFLINPQTATTLGPKANKLSQDFTNFLLQVQQEAPAITEELMETL